MNTIYALSSGQPPAALAVVRISGTQSGAALMRLAGALPQPRRASLRLLRAQDGTILDQALVLWFPGPGTATGEDLAELHLHGGRAVVTAVSKALGAMPGLREAEPGEFTRRAFSHGRIDLAEAEGLADLLAAETELQRRSALALAGGALSREVDGWRDRVLRLGASVEAVLDFSDEGDVGDLPQSFSAELRHFHAELTDWLARPRAEALKDGFRVVIAGPPNAGKSTLFNSLVDCDAAITSPDAGTTRDALHRSVALGGIAFTFIDTAGLREAGADRVEAIGMERARGEVDRADLVLWLGPEGEGPDGAWEIEAQCDREEHPAKRKPSHRLSALSGEGMDRFREALVAHARQSMPAPGEVALNRRQHAILARAGHALSEAAMERDPLLAAEQLREARLAFDQLTGRASTEDMLDALFGRFCIGK